VIISTAGTGDKTHRSWQAYQYAKKVIAGDVVDPQTLAIVYECPNAAELEGEDIYDLDLLVACNPVLQEDAAKRAQAAKEIDEARHKRNDAWWRRFRLNQWLATDGEMYITPAEYAANETKPMSDEHLAGYDCFVGIDRGGVWDFSAATLLFELADGKVYEKHITYAVADRIEEMNEADDQDYQQYAERGELVIVPAEVVMDEWIAEHLKGVLAKFSVKTIAADAFNAAYIIESLAAQGWDVVKVSQSNNRALTPVIEDYAERYRKGRIVHPANGLVGWQLQHARKYQTSKDSVKIVKAGSNTKGQGGTGHIDNVDSALNALAALRAEALKNAAGTSGVTVA
jgi:phage terminase large subunit-like protein